MSVPTSKASYRQHEYSGARKSLKRVRSGIKRYYGEESRVKVWRAGETKKKRVNEEIVNNSIITQNTQPRTYARLKPKIRLEATYSAPSTSTVTAEPVVEPLEINWLQPDPVDTDVFDDDKNGAEDDSDTIVESNVCRVCLALDVKMYDLKDIALREMFQTITGILVTENNHFERLCWECAGRLKTAADFRNKALLSDTLLQGLANTSKQVRKNDITLLKDNKGYLKLASNLSTVETFHTVNIDAVDLNIPTIAENNDIETVRNIYQKDSTEPNESIVKRHTDVMGSKHELKVESLIKTEKEYDPVNINGDDELMTEAQISTEIDFDSIDPNTGENRIIVSETNSFVSNTSNIEDTNYSAVTSPLPGCSNSELLRLLKTPNDCGDEIKKTPTKVKNSDSISKVVSKKTKVDHDHKYVKGDAKIKNVNTTVGGIRKETLNKKLVKKTRNKANTTTYHEW